MGKRWAPLLAVLAVAAVYAAVTITNISEWAIHAVAPPVWKVGNASLYPLLDSSWSEVEGLNVTRYRLLFVPGWREEYTVGWVVNDGPAVARFEKVSEVGSGAYSIYLGGQLQLSNAQSSGPDVTLPADIRWDTTASSKYSVSAWLAFKSGATAKQLVNFTAEPMSLLANWTCALKSFSDDFSGACVRAYYSFNISIPNNRTYISEGSGPQAIISIVNDKGDPPPSLHTAAHNGITSFFVNYSSSPFSASTSFAFQYLLGASIADDDYLEVNFFIDTSGDGSPDIEVIYYGSRGGMNPPSMAQVFYSRNLPREVRTIPGFSTSLNEWISISISQVYPTGIVVGVAFTAVSYKGVLKVWWDNVEFQRCAPPSYLRAVTEGGSVTIVYVDDTSSPSNPPSVATEVDARCADNPSSCYGLSAAVYDVAAKVGSPVAASGFTFSVRGLYVKNDSDVRNNVAYVSVGVDANGDGYVDTEYIYYRNDTVEGPAWIAPVFSTTVTVYEYHLDGMVSGNSYTWSGSLPSNQQGNVLYIAFAAVDARGNATGLADDFWVYWDDLSFSCYACDPVPNGWIVSGDVFYRGLVPGGIAYAANFTGVHPYGFYFFDSSLNPVFGVSVEAPGSFKVVCGASSYALTVSGVYWVDLRLLSGVYEAILRDGSGGILERRACGAAGGVSYVGFKGVDSFIVKVWGIPP